MWWLLGTKRPLVSYSFLNVKLVIRFRDEHFIIELSYIKRH